MNESEQDADASTQQAAGLQEGLDYYVEDGLFVFTATFLLKRGYCCESGCRHCPYQKRDHGETHSLGSRGSFGSVQHKS